MSENRVGVLITSFVGIWFVGLGIMVGAVFYILCRPAGHPAIGVMAVSVLRITGVLFGCVSVVAGVWILGRQEWARRLGVAVLIFCCVALLAMAVAGLSLTGGKSLTGSTIILLVAGELLLLGWLWLTTRPMVKQIFH